MIRSRNFSRWAPLRSATWFALGFVVLRVVYRVVFLGANGPGVVLWNVRPLHLEGPFQFISLFGPVTTGGLCSSVADAAPFAFGIIAIGAILSVVDVRRALARSAVLPVGRGILTATAIGVSTFPSLVVSWRSMRRVHRLRRERGGFSVLAPLFERTLERANVLAASMEVRGFGRSQHQNELDCNAPAKLDNVRLAFSGSGPTGSKPLSFEIGLGEFVLVTGPTGSGKSSLLRAIAGLHQHSDAGTMTGTISVGGSDRVQSSIAQTSGFLGFVPQCVRESFVAPTVYEELAFGLAMQHMPRAAIDVRLDEIINPLGLAPLLDRRVEHLSAGEAVLVGIAAALVTRPTILLLDEPLADLDHVQAGRVTELLASLHRTTAMSIIVAEHRTALLVQRVSRHIELGVGLAPIDDLADVTDAVTSGTITALVGPNGCGKTTRLFDMACANPTQIALVPEDLSDFFVRDSVEQECRRSDRTARCAPGSTQETFESLLQTSSQFTHQHPRDLSHGQQVALAIAIALAGSPKELLIDEPTRGLDPQVCGRLARMLRVVSSRVKVTVATHDDQFARLLRAESVVVSA